MVAQGAVPAGGKPCPSRPATKAARSLNSNEVVAQSPGLPRKAGATLGNRCTKSPSLCGPRRRESVEHLFCIQILCASVSLWLNRQMLDHEKEHRPGLGFAKRFAAGFPMEMAAHHRVRPRHFYRTAPRPAPSRDGFHRSFHGSSEGGRVLRCSQCRTCTLGSASIQSRSGTDSR